MLVVDACTGVGWTSFLGDKGGVTLGNDFRSWHTAAKSITTAVHGGSENACFDNGDAFTSADFRRLLEELGVALNGKVAWKGSWR